MTTLTGCGALTASFQPVLVSTPRRHRTVVVSATINIKDKEMSKLTTYYPYMDEQDDMINSIGTKIAHSTTSNQTEKTMTDLTTSINATEYAAANEFDDNTRRVELERIAADTYQKRCETGVSEELLTKAIATIAAAFYEMGTPYEDRDGVTQSYNDLDFQQKSALSNICNNSNWMMSSSAERITKLFTEMDQLEATFRGSDNEIFQMNRCAEQIERLKGVQIPTLRKYGAITKAAYLGVRGEQWKPYAKSKTSPQEQSKQALLERVRRLREE